MDFGRRADTDGVSFVLPRTPARSDRVLALGRPGMEPWLRIGAPAWSRRDWVGKLYPPGATQRDFLRLYARAAGAIELNASFYGLPNEATVTSWVEETPRTFRFCPKVPREISHARGLAGPSPALPLASPAQGRSRDAGAELAAFVARFRLLGERLGPALLQLPPWFGPDRRGALAAFLAGWPDDLPLAVELRHEGWFDRGTLLPAALDLLEAKSAAAVITCVTGRRDVCHASLTAPFTMVRFVGNALHPTDESRSGAWLDRLLEWRARGLESAYFFVHQPDDVLAPELMASFAARARERGVEVPRIALGSPQQELF